MNFKTLFYFHINIHFTFSANIPIYGKKINLEFYPEDIQFIDQVLNKYNLDHGYAFWGYGNRLVFLSKRKLTIVPYLYKTPLHWDVNKNGYKKHRSLL